MLWRPWSTGDFCGRCGAQINTARPWSRSLSTIFCRADQTIFSRLTECFILEKKGAKLGSISLVLKNRRNLLEIKAWSHSPSQRFVPTALWWRKFFKRVVPEGRGSCFSVNGHSHQSGSKNCVRAEATRQETRWSAINFWCLCNLRTSKMTSNSRKRSSQCYVGPRPAKSPAR